MQSILNVNILQLSQSLEAVLLLKERKRKENSSFPSAVCTKERFLYW